MKKPKELIKCPNGNCGTIQSRKEYEAHCCWSCGSILPLPKSLPVQLPQSTERVRIADVEQVDTFDESRVKKMSDY